MLSRIATAFAEEISNHDWSDSPYRLDRAGHHREDDSNRGSRVLEPMQTACVQGNVVFVTAQVLEYMDPNLDLHEFAEACGLPRTMTHNRDGRRSGGITAGLRMIDGVVAAPGDRGARA